MREASTSEELLELLDSTGKVSEPVRLVPDCQLYGLLSVTSLKDIQLAPGCRLYGLTSVTSLKGVQLVQGCVLSGLSSVTSLEGVQFAEGCALCGLSSVTSLEGLQLAKGCELYDLSSVTSLEGLQLAPGCKLYHLPSDVVIPEIPVSADEAAILEHIPVESCDMSTWHRETACGTTHCLAGYAQFLCGDMSLDSYDEGCRLLPSVSHLFYAPTKPVREWLKAKRWVVR